MINKLASLATVAALSLTLLAPSAVAKDGDVVRRGACDGASSWKLKLSPDDPSIIRVALEVDENVVGHTWRIRVRHNGEPVLKAKRTTQAPSGSFTLRTRLPDLPGTDRVRAKAVNPATGERCIARAALRN